MITLTLNLHYDITLAVFLIAMTKYLVETF